MRARAAQIQPLDGGAVAAPTRYGTHEQNLVESELSVVEALLGCFQLHLIRLHFQDTRNPRRQLAMRSEEHTSELQSLAYLVCRLLLEKKKTVVEFAQ